MFDAQINRLTRLQGKVHQDVIDEMMNLLGACQDVLHKGGLRLVDDRDTGATDGVLEVSNGYHGTDDQYTDAPRNGKALWVKKGLARFDGPVLGVLRFGVANANWNNVAGWLGANVTVDEADEDGTAVTPTRSVTVYLPRTASQDPNVRANDVITYTLTSSGRAIGVNYALDDKIRTTKMWVGSIGTIPGGWALMDGTANSVGNGGSGYDMGARFPGCYKSGDPSFGSIGGTIAASISGSVNSNTTGLTVNSATTGISITDHDYDHKHYSTIQGNSGTSTLGPVDVSISGVTPVASDYYAYLVTSDVISVGTTSGWTLSQPSSSSTTLSHSITDSGHSHGVTDPGHTHTITSVSALTPATLVVAFIERIS